MKRIINLLLISAALVIAAGCAKTETKLRVNPATGELSWTSPKNVSITNIVAVVGTNGTRTVTVGSFETKNDPEVLKSAGDANVNMVNAVGTQLRGAFKDGIEAAAAGATKP